MKFLLTSDLLSKKLKLIKKISWITLSYFNYSHLND